jgi:two-component system NtrC family sensor kinase
MGILKGSATFATHGPMPLTASHRVTSLPPDVSAVPAGPAQDRHTPAETPQWPVARHPSRALTLGTRLALSVALSVATVISLVAMAGAFVAGQELESDLRETARITAVALADEIELRTPPPTQESLLPMLRNFMNAAIDLNAISVFDATTDPPTLTARTSELVTVPESVVRQTIRSDSATWSVPDHSIVTIAAPFERGNTVIGVVAVSVSLRGISQVQRAAGLVALVGVLVAAAAITLLIHLRARQLILEPLAAIRRVMARARSGDLAARARVPHDDELREVADGLNAMLSELEDLHRTLTERVASKTEELRERNAQLVRSYESVLQLRETAARAQELAAVGQTMANVAHQIGTPLNLASGHVQLLQRELTDPALQRRLTIVQDQIERVASAVRDLLQRARPRPDVHLVDLVAMLRRIAEAIRLRLSAAHVTLVDSLPEQLPAVSADETQLELAVLNLITNAVDAMPGGGTVTLTASAGPRTVRIEVTDTGTGISADMLPHIFQPWVTTKLAGEGTGLGLSITRDVVSRLGGTVGASSAPGRGATFVIELPANRQEPHD